MSTDDISARERRIRQFEHYIGLMEHRALKLIQDECYLILSVAAPPEIRPRIGGSETRIVQFAFIKAGFYLDLPDTTLMIDEAKLLVAERPGFGYALQRTRKTLGERRFDPVQRRYQYAHHRTAAHRTAAEDTAYVFFDLWQTPLDAYIDVTAATFEGNRRWETDFSLG